MIFAVALAASARIAGLAYLHDGVQSLATRADCTAGGAIDTNLTWRRRRPTLDRALASISDVARIRRQLGGTCGGIAIPAAQVLAGGAVIVSPNHTAPLAVLFALDVIMRARLRFGVDGGDEMLRVVTSALLLAALSTAVSVQYAAVTFLAMTSCAAYMAPGWLKLSSRTWWTGRALIGIVSTLELGWAPAAANACAALRRRDDLLSRRDPVGIAVRVGALSRSTCCTRRRRVGHLVSCRVCRRNGPRRFSRAIRCASTVRRGLRRLAVQARARTHPPRLRFYNHCRGGAARRTNPAYCDTANRTSTHRVTISTGGSSRLGVAKLH